MRKSSCAYQGAIIFKNSAIVTYTLDLCWSEVASLRAFVVKHVCRFRKFQADKGLHDNAMGLFPELDRCFVFEFERRAFCTRRRH